MRRGFTLLEICISLAVLVMGFSIALPSLESVSGVRMRTSAGQLAGCMRALFDRAALSGQTCRMAFDLDARTYWPECAQQAARISSIKEESRDGKAYVDEQAKQAEADRLADLEKDNPIEAQIEAKVPFSEFKDEDMKRYQLPDDVSFAWVWTPHQSQKYTAGAAYVYFFPQGNAERGIVVLKHGDDDLVSLALNPLSGKVRLESGELEVPKQ